MGKWQMKMGGGRGEDDARDSVRNFEGQNLGVCTFVLIGFFSMMEVELLIRLPQVESLAASTAELHKSTN